MLIRAVTAKTTYKGGRFARSWHWTPQMNGPVKTRQLTPEQLRALLQERK